MPGELPGDDDHGYADAYNEEMSEEASHLPTNRTSDGENDDDSDVQDDDKELAEMFAKLQNIQQFEGVEVQPVQVKEVHSRSQPSIQLEVAIPDRHTAKRSAAKPMSSRSSSPSVGSRTVSPAASSALTVKASDGIITLSRKTLASSGREAHADLLTGVKKPILFQQRLLQNAKEQPHVLEKLTQKVVIAGPSAIARRIEVLSQPKQSDSNHKFALDDERKHCRFRLKTSKKNESNGRDAYEDEDVNAQNRVNDFLARMEATERNRQKKLEMTRGEKEYLANLNKKICPKCEVTQSYSEYRDKKKRCQTCGSEFRVPQAWGDIGSEFISRISEDSRTRDERKQQIRAQVVLEESNKGRVAKSTTQQYYEKSLQQRSEHKTFIERNYTAMAATIHTATSSMAKTKQAELQLEMQLKERRSKLLAAAQPPIY